MLKFFRSESLIKDFFYAAIVIIFVVVLVSFVLSFSSYRAFMQEKNQMYEMESGRVVNDLQEYFSYLSKSLNFMASKIINGNPDDLRFIENILKKSSLVPRTSDDIFTWTMFDYVSPEGYIVVDSVRGVIESPTKIDGYKRNWLDLARAMPWKLHFSSPDIGMTSGEAIIPTGFGFTDSHNNFKGIISIGFNINKLNQKIVNLLDHNGVVFVIIDQNKKLITCSKQIAVPTEDEIIQSTKHEDFESQNVGFLKNNLVTTDAVYSHFRTILNSPYIILIGSTHSQINSALHTVLFPQIFTSISLAIFFLILLYFFRKKIVNPVIELSKVTDSVKSGDISNIKLPLSNSIEMYKITSHIEKIVEYTKELHNAQIDLIKSKDSLSDALAKIEKLKQSQKEFVDSIKYYTRFPMQMILNKINMLKLKSIENQSDSSMIDVSNLDDLEELLSYTQTLIEDFVDIAQYNYTKLQLKNVQYDLKKQLHYCMMLVQCLSTDVKIDIKFNKSVPKIFVDKRRFNQIIVNLFTTSLIHTDTSSIILVNIFYDQDIKIMIKDVRVSHRDYDLERKNLYKNEEHKNFSRYTDVSYLFVRNLSRNLGVNFEYIVQDDGVMASITIPESMLLDKK